MSDPAISNLLANPLTNLLANRLVVQPHLCTGCRSCELACAFAHGAKGIPGSSRCVTVSVGKSAFVPMLCLQCDEAACAKVCPTAAIVLDDSTGVWSIDQDRCIRCMACTVACPFGNMHVDRASSSVNKCDLCADQGGHPRCAMFCPSKCLVVEPR
ncbi:MAG: 4Fe-4S dicluster domain-containing protein [Pseudomonadota bacterium]